MQVGDAVMLPKGSCYLAASRPRRGILREIAGDEAKVGVLTFSKAGVGGPGRFQRKVDEWEALISVKLIELTAA